MDRHAVIDLFHHSTQRLRHFETASEEVLASTYAPGKWPVRVLINHVADADLALYLRFLKCVAGERAIQPFDENAWVRELEEERRPVSVSIAQSEAIRRGFVHYLESLSDEKLARTAVHPERGELSALQLARMAAMHCEHHLRQAECARDGRQWTPEMAVRHPGRGARQKRSSTRGTKTRGHEG